MAKIRVDGYRDHAGYFDPEVDIVNEDGLYETFPYDPELHEIQHILDCIIHPGDPRLKTWPQVPRYHLIGLPHEEQYPELYES